MAKEQDSFAETSIKEGKTIAIISYLTPIGLIVALIMNLKKKNSFASFHILQMGILTILMGISFVILNQISSQNGQTPYPVGGRIIIAFLEILWLNSIIGAIIGTKRLIPNGFPDLKNTFTFFIIGAILGLPLSYYLQPQIVRQKISLLDYVKKIDMIFKAEDLIGNIILSVIVFAIIGAIIGYFIDRDAKRKAV